MSGWFRTPKQKLYATALFLLTLVFGVLMTISLIGDGTEIFKKVYNEAVFEEEEIAPANVGTFTLDSEKLCMLEVKGLTLDQSWLWVSAVILDEKDRPVLSYTFDLSYYHGYEGGESWSEGDKDDYKLFRLPAGNYKIMVHGEDEPSKTSTNPFAINTLAFTSNGYTTIDRNEAIQVRVTKGVWMTRYFLIMFLLFGTLLCIYCYIRSERSQYEAAPGYAGYEPPTYDSQAYYQQAQGDQDQSASYYQGYSPDPKDPQNPNT